jgi:pimeloyl-ACP methyl ester carboxylesterase
MDSRSAFRLVIHWRTVLESFLETWDGGDAEAAIGIILDYWNGAGSWAATPRAHRERIFAGATRFHAEVRSAHGDRTAVAELCGLAVPTLVVSGANTTEAALLVCDILAETIPGARSLRVRGAGHSPMRSHPELFADALCELTASVGRGAPDRAPG